MIEEIRAPSDVKVNVNGVKKWFRKQRSEISLAKKQQEQIRTVQKIIGIKSDEKTKPDGWDFVAAAAASFQHFC